MAGMEPFEPCPARAMPAKPIHVSLVVFPRVRSVDHLRRVRHAVGAGLVLGPAHGKTTDQRAVRAAPRGGGARAARAHHRRQHHPAGHDRRRRAVPTSCLCRTSWSETAESMRSARPPAARLDQAHACAGRAALRGLRRLAGAGRGGAARRLRGHDALELCAAVPPALSQRDAARGPHPGAERPRPQRGLLGRRLVLAGPGAAADRQARRHGRGDPHLQAVPLPVAPRRPAALRVDDRQCRSWRRRHPALPDLARPELRARRRRRRAGAPVGPAEAHLRPPLPGRDRLLAARLCAGAAHRGGQAVAGDGRCHGRARSRARSATRTWPPSGACSAALPA